jgi:VacB/RNase II family 3'-5' exoribonuclease
MAKAIYSTENIGHYGLAFNHYTHFTSPIRRYPDVMVHRLLFKYLNDKSRVNKDEIEKLCKHSSEMEIIASRAERDSIKYMQAVYISKFVGEKLEGIVSGVTDFGIFIEVSNTSCEGLIRLKDIQGDFYKYDEKNYCIRGSKGGNTYRIGDKVDVKVRSVNIEKREINLILL